MKNIKVNTSLPYNVIIGSNILQQIGVQIASLCSVQTVAIISDTNVWNLYGACVKDSINQEHLHVVHHTFPPGECYKSPQTYMEIANFLAEHQMTRSDVLVALGGGVVGDIVGFVAATYLRGIRYVQVPTSLLAMVDSSVGGKTAVNLPAGKNLLGAFYQPSFVLCDICTLDTLPSDHFRDGCAEIIKYGVLYDPDILTHLVCYGFSFDREYVIGKCIALKAQVVEVDERDGGSRQKLNLGHTVGHAVEAISHFSLTHGQSVSIGMSIIVRAAQTHKYCSKDTEEQIISVLRFWGLPTTTEYTATELLQYIKADKKRQRDTQNLIIPRQIGCCDIVTMTIDQLHSFIEAGLS